MTKVAVYGFIRIVFDLLGPPTWWSANVVLVLGGVTAVMGVLHALMERDLKRLLAYSTVENIGIIFIGIGLAMAFRSNGYTVGAALALTAALFHALNHTVFKSLLFFGAGAVLHGDRERDMERLGGLIHRMPWTAFRDADRLRRDLGVAAAERFRVGVADVPGDPAASGDAAMGSEADDPGRWRVAGADRSAGRGLFRRCIRHHVSSAGRAPHGGADRA